MRITEMSGSLLFQIIFFMTQIHRNQIPGWSENKQKYKLVIYEQRYSSNDVNDLLCFGQDNT